MSTPSIAREAGVVANGAPKVTRDRRYGRAPAIGTLLIVGEIDGRQRRLQEELNELAPGVLASIPDAPAVIEELDYAIRPPIHERRVPTYGAIVKPAVTSSRWSEITGIEVDHRQVADLADAAVRRFADGLASFAGWLVAAAGVIGLAGGSGARIKRWLRSLSSDDEP